MDYYPIKYLILEQVYYYTIEHPEFDDIYDLRELGNSFENPQLSPAVLSQIFWISVGSEALQNVPPSILKTFFNDVTEARQNLQNPPDPAS
jgi:hypothetical protein